ncbi:hypothetical protein SYNPS1DRAFT_27059 [Syncephalis pseudoplumigaleata]|uniref:DH domain-containing protein n=1 Tax=Syncephalis pseudoplumigaleata TaxID=1712513 RepID=A0A4P9Z5C2_9FUNG|nr:hypothetical protein SYNPS1DRAFT_27059 [Syncephalis pseudoplumigaleata]|eukprot:RKP27282.1 hypothetical protein SYNPS1DRAFT_27059 [Syncephalis pseudoplumigaleata]
MFAWKRVEANGQRMEAAREGNMPDLVYPRRRPSAISVYYDTPGAANNMSSPTHGMPSNAAANHMVPPSPTSYRSSDTPMLRKRLSVMTSSTMRSDNTFDLPTPTSLSPDSPGSSMMDDWHHQHQYQYRQQQQQQQQHMGKLSPQSPTVMIADAAARGFAIHSNGSNSSMDHARMMADPKTMMMSPGNNGSGKQLLSPKSPRTVINRTAQSARQQSAKVAQSIGYDQESVGSSPQRTRENSRRSSVVSDKKSESAIASRMRQEFGLNHADMSMSDPHFAQWVLYSGRSNANLDEERGASQVMSAHPHHENEQVIDFMMSSSSSPSKEHLQEASKSKRSTLNGFTGLVRKATGRLALNGAIFRSKGDADEDDDQYQLEHGFHLGLDSTAHHAMNFDELYGDEDEAFDMNSNNNNRFSVNTQNDYSPEITRQSPRMKITGPGEASDIPELNSYTIAEEDEEDEDEARMMAYINADAKPSGNELMPPPTRIRRYVSKETIASVYRIIESYQKEDGPGQDGNVSALSSPVMEASSGAAAAANGNPIPEMAALELHELGGRRSSGSLPPKPSRATQLLTSLSHLQSQMGSQPLSPTTYGSQASLGRRRSSKSAQSQKHSSIVNMQRSPTVESGSGYSTFVDVFCDYRDAWLGEEEEELEHLEEERLKALYNLIASEKKFVRTLQLIRNAFIEPLRLNAAKSNRFIHRSYTKDEITAIFGTIEQLLPRHEKLLRDLEQSALDRKQTGIMENAIATFTQNCRWLRLHMDYLRQYPQMLFDLVQLQKRSTHFRRTLKTCTANAGFVNVRALLASPKGRIHQYHAFILQLLDLYQPEDPDYMTIKLCADDLERMDKECSLMLLFVQQRESVIQVQSSLNGLDDKFVSSTRRLIHQGSLYQGEKSWDKFEPRIAFLFDDLLVLAKEQAEGRRVLQHRIDTRTATVQEMHGVIVIACDSGKKYHLQAENADQHNYWMQCFRTVMRSTGTSFTGALGTLSFA